ncbi:nuclear transport factor 2 family protein [Pseudomaricurvus alcaniphilus]|nr:nuclear transport factor 2 family protein [Pseudomaricurvus alcaniphilus]
MRRRPVPPLLDEFKALYRELGPVNTRSFNRVYHDNVKFKDPVHEVHSAASLLTYMEDMCQTLDFCKFEYLDELVAADAAYIKWNMNFRHPRLGDKTHTVRGMSHIQFDDRIYFHEDVYDLGQMVYEHVPVLGGMTRWVKARLAS